MLSGFTTPANEWQPQLSNRTLARDSLGRYTTTYDAVGQVKSTVTPAGKRITYRLDGVGLRKCMSDPDGGRFTYTFDANRRVTKLINPWSERTTWTYNMNDRTTVQRNANAISLAAS